MRSLVAFLLGACVLTACASAGRVTSADGFPSGTVVSFSSEQARGWRTYPFTCPSGYAPDSAPYWTAPADRVEEVDRVLFRDLRTALSREGEGVRRPDEYYRQYVGVFCGGVAMIRVEGAHRTDLESSAAHRQLTRQQPDTLTWRVTPFDGRSHAGTSKFWAWYRADGSRFAEVQFGCCRRPPR